MTAETLRIVQVSAPISDVEGNPAVGREARLYDLVLVLNRQADLYEQQALGQLWRERPHGAGDPWLVLQADQQTVRLPGVPSVHLVTYYKVTRDLLAEVPERARDIQGAEKRTLERVRGALEAIRADIAAQSGDAT